MHILRQDKKVWEESDGGWVPGVILLTVIIFFSWIAHVTLRPEPTELDCMNLLDRGIPCDILD